MSDTLENIAAGYYAQARAAESALAAARAEIERLRALQVAAEHHVNANTTARGATFERLRDAVRAVRGAK